MAERKICIVTGSRAEYGLLAPLMKHVADDAELALQVVATGMHLSPEFGLTYRSIEQDGFTIDAKVEMVLSSDTAIGIGKAIGLGVIGLVEAYARLRPDIVVVLGDRFEILAAAQAALVSRIPLAHIHGGEVSEGAIDEAMRHAITKFAHLHFVAAAAFRERVIQLGEDPDRVFNVGAPGVDQISAVALMGRAELEQTIRLKLGTPNFLVTYHPATLGARPPMEAARELLRALNEFPSARILFTAPNADEGGRAIAAEIETFVGENPGRACCVAVLGTRGYLSAISHVDVVIGNSSSGIIEVPFFRKPTVNIGDRQRGRPRASSVIDCGEERASIAAGIRTALSPQFHARLATVVSPYGQGGASARIKDILKSVRLEGILVKRFFDLQAR